MVCETRACSRCHFLLTNTYLYVKYTVSVFLREESELSHYNKQVGYELSLNEADVATFIEGQWDAAPVLQYLTPLMMGGGPNKPAAELQFDVWFNIENVDIEERRLREIVLNDIGVSVLIDKQSILINQKTAAGLIEECHASIPVMQNRAVTTNAIYSFISKNHPSDAEKEMINYLSVMFNGFVFVDSKRRSEILLNLANNVVKEGQFITKHYDVNYISDVAMKGVGFLIKPGSIIDNYLTGYFEDDIKRQLQEEYL